MRKILSDINQIIGKIIKNAQIIDDDYNHSELLILDFENDESFIIAPWGGVGNNYREESGFNTVERPSDIETPRNNQQFLIDLGLKTQAQIDEEEKERKRIIAENVKKAKIEKEKEERKLYEELKKKYESSSIE